MTVETQSVTQSQCGGRSGRAASTLQFFVGLFLHDARHGRQRGRLRLQALILETLVAIVVLVVHSGTVQGPFFRCFIGQNVRGLL